MNEVFILTYSPFRKWAIYRKTIDSLYSTKLEQVCTWICSTKFFLKLFLHVSKSQYFFPIWILIFLIYYVWVISRNKLKKHSITKNCSDLSLFEWIVPVISNFLLILSLQPLISKVFLITRTIFSHNRSEFGYVTKYHYIKVG